MSLILPPWGFANSVSNLTGTPPAQNAGTTFSAGLSNVDGTAVSVLSALDFDCHYLVVSFSGLNTNAALGRALADILVDPAGGTSWSALIDDLVVGFTTAPGNGGGIPLIYRFPVFIAAGSSLGVRARTSHTVSLTAGRIIIQAYGNPSRPEMWWCGQKVESLGITAASSKGVDVTPGNTGTFGSWTTIGTTTGRYGAVQFSPHASSAASTASGYYWQIGSDSVQLPGSQTMYATVAAQESRANNGQDMIWCDIPEGTVLQLRATCSTTAEVFDAAIYGVY
jgi:hypothetical protein